MSFFINTTLLAILSIMSVLPPAIIHCSGPFSSLAPPISEIMNSQDQVDALRPLEVVTMRAVITGGAGFLGSYLCEYFLEKGWEVLCLDNLLTGADSNVSH